MSKKGKAQLEMVCGEQVINKLANASYRLNNCKADQDELTILKARHDKNVKKITSLCAAYNIKFLIAITINTVIFSMLSGLLLKSMPPLDVLILIMFNFVVISSLLLNSVISNLLLNKIESATSEADSICEDVDTLVARQSVC